jgi:hypothetical protein
MSDECENEKRLRMTAIQLVGQLSTDIYEARQIIRYMEELMDTFLTRASRPAIHLIRREAD